MYRQYVESVVAKFTAPRTLLTNPLEQTLLMGMPDGTGTAARAQQLSLHPTQHTAHSDQPSNKYSETMCDGEILIK